MIHCQSAQAPGIEFLFPGIFFAVIGYLFMTRPGLFPDVGAFPLLKKSPLWSKGVGGLSMVFGILWTIFMAYLIVRPLLGC